MDQYSLIQRTRYKESHRQAHARSSEISYLAKCQSIFIGLYFVFLKYRVFTSLSLGKEAALLLANTSMILNYLQNCQLTSSVLSSFRCLNLRNQLGLGESRGRDFLCSEQRNAANFLKWNDLILSEALSANDPWPAVSLREANCFNLCLSVFPTDKFADLALDKLRSVASKMQHIIRLE